MKKAVFLLLLLSLSVAYIQFSINSAKGDTTSEFQVNASTDDCLRRLETSEYFGLTAGYDSTGYYSATYYEYGSGLRFNDVTIPQNAKIKEAYLNLTCEALRYGAFKTRISAEKHDNATTFVDNGTIFDNRYNNHTTTVVDWDSSDYWAKDSVYQSPDISNVIEEITNRSGWVSGNSIVLFWEDFDSRSSVSGSQRRSYSYDGSTTKCAKLIIKWVIEFSVTFQFNTGGQFRVNNVTVTNGTKYIYENTTVLELVAVVVNSSYVFLSFNWTSGSSVSNPHNYTVTSNMTIWCYFDSTPEGEPPKLELCPKCMK